MNIFVFFGFLNQGGSDGAWLALITDLLPYKPGTVRHFRLNYFISHIMCSHLNNLNLLHHRDSMIYFCTQL